MTTELNILTCREILDLIYEYLVDTFGCIHTSQGTDLLKEMDADAFLIWAYDKKRLHISEAATWNTLKWALNY